MLEIILCMLEIDSRDIGMEKQSKQAANSSSELVQVNYYELVPVSLDYLFPQ